MALNEEIVTGGKFRRLIDVASKKWQRISLWSKASDVEFNDGKTAQTKIGAINGITSDVNGESDSVAASIKVVNQLNKTVSELNSNLISPYFRNSVRSENIVPATTEAIYAAQFIANAPTANVPSARAGYAFHNFGYTAGFLYLDTDGRLKFIDNAGTISTIKFE